MNKLRRSFSIFLSMTLAALTFGWMTACVPIRSSLSTSPQPPTEAPAATLSHLQPTESVAVPEGFYATRQAGSQATIEARATAFPFPAARPGTVVQGWPSSALGQRDGLELEVRLPKDSYLAGEGGLAEVEIRNNGPETVFVNGSGIDLASLALIDERGRQPDPWPPSFSRYLTGGPPYLQKLVPGDVLDKTLQFQVPPLQQNPPSHLFLWAETRFSRPEPGNPEGADNLWLRLEAGPIDLNVTTPDPSKYLRVDWRLDRTGWHLGVKNAADRVPPGPFWGEIGAASPNSLCSGPLHGEQSAPGAWAGSWNEYSLPVGSQIIAEGWIATDGYVTAVFIQTLPGEGDAGQMLGLYDLGPKRENFSTLGAAQATLDFPILALSPFVIGSTLENVQVERCCGKNPDQTSVEQQVELSSGVWLVLTQIVPSTNYESAGWGQARYDQEARQVEVRGQTGYAIQRFGWWYLDWKVGQMGFELRAPAAWLSIDDLSGIANRLGG